GENGRAQLSLHHARPEVGAPRPAAPGSLCCRNLGGSGRRRAALSLRKGSRGDLAVTIRELLWATLRISFIDGITQCCSLRPGKCYSPWPFSAWLCVPKTSSV